MKHFVPLYTFKDVKYNFPKYIFENKYKFAYKDNECCNSKIVIENFKVENKPYKEITYYQARFIVNRYLFGFTIFTDAIFENANNLHYHILVVE